MTPKNFRK